MPVVVRDHCCAEAGAADTRRKTHAAVPIFFIAATPLYDSSCRARSRCDCSHSDRRASSSAVTRGERATESGHGTLHRDQKPETWRFDARRRDPSAPGARSELQRQRGPWFAQPHPRRPRSRRRNGAPPSNSFSGRAAAGAGGFHIHPHPRLATAASAFPRPQSSRSRRCSRFGEIAPCCPRTSASWEPV